MSKLSEKPSENLTTHGPALLSPEFSIEQRRTLLRIAHEAILSVLEGRPFSEAPPFPAGLSDPRGVFTTLYLTGDPPGDLHRELRGCVGYALPIVPLYRAVAETARAAAFEDSRFLPVTKEEALELEVSLSVLSRLFPIHPEAVEVGRHGLLLSHGARRGLLLPQVPVEHGWDRETFLEQTCRKAGLPLDAWRKNATIEAFTAEVFADTDVASGCRSSMDT
jgi:AmmeMemoRadiSam system protein A